MISEAWPDEQRETIKACSSNHIDVKNFIEEVLKTTTIENFVH